MMRIFWHALVASAATGLLVLFLLSVRVPVSDAAIPAQGAPPAAGPIVSAPVTPTLSQPLDTLPRVPSGQPPVQPSPRRQPPGTQQGVSSPPIVDPLLDNSRRSFARENSPAPLQSFEGADNTNSFCGCAPPDPIGDVGPNHYVQLVNNAMTVFSKAGSVLTGPIDLTSVWSGFGGGSCTGGDPMVAYDQFADRWVLGVIDDPNTNSPKLCIAVSTSPNPTGSYYRYAFPASAAGTFPDYPKLGVWRDAYYVGTNEADISAIALDRTNMLLGQPATSQRFVLSPSNFMLPADADGALPPPVNSPGYFYTFENAATSAGGSDRLELWGLHVDWISSTNSTFTRVASIPISAFNYTVCGYFNLNCQPQPGTSQKFDVVSEWPMWRFQYRNFGTYQSLVGNFTVDVDNTDRAGIRWFELRNTGGDWSLYQEGTHSPDATDRFMGSIAMDSSGNIGLGYSVASTVTYPSLRYAVRRPTDTPGTLQTETTLITGGGSQTASNRWGDYSAMTVDPSDGCTFWYTGEYYSANSPDDWHTRIGSFKLSGCLPRGALTSAVTSAATGQAIAGALIQVTLSPTQSYTTTTGALGTYGALFPVGTITVTATASGYVSATFGGVSIGTESITARDFALTGLTDLGIRVSDNQVTAVPGLPLTYTIVVTNGGLLPVYSARVTDTFPAALGGVTWTCAGSAGSSCAANGGGTISQPVTITAGGAVTFTAIGLVNPVVTGTLTNSAAVAPPPGMTDTNTTNDSSTDVDTLTPQVSFTVTIAKTSGDTQPGDPVSYVITVTNAGPSAGSGLVSGQIVPGLTGITNSCSASAGSACTGPFGSSPGDGSTSIAQAVYLLPNGTAVIQIGGVPTGLPVTPRASVAVTATGGATALPGGSPAASTTVYSIFLPVVSPNVVLTTPAQ